MNERLMKYTVSQKKRVTTRPIYHLLQLLCFLTGFVHIPAPITAQFMVYFLD